MRLLDVATVVTTDDHFPSGGDPRDCNVKVTLDEICEDVTGIVVDSAEADVYRFQPFGITADLFRPVTCQRDDDLNYINKAMTDVTDRAVGLALVVPLPSNPTAWIGHTEVAEAAGAIAGRSLWLKTHVGSPILHAAPSDLPGLADAGLVKVGDQGKEHYTVWGDPVVLNESYEGFPSFWTGALTIYLSTVRTEQLFNARGNYGNTLALRHATIDLGTCGIVRNGPMSGENPFELPSVVTHPQSLTVEEGDIAAFNATATGNPIPTQQWQSSADGTGWVDIAGATEGNFSISPVGMDDDGFHFRAVFSNSEGAVSSNPAILSVTPLPAPEPSQWVDTFDRADGPAGNGWFNESGGAGVPTILSNQLYLNGGSGFQRMGNPGHPAVSRFEVQYPAATPQYTGIFFGRDATHAGVKVFQATTGSGAEMSLATAADSSVGTMIPGLRAALAAGAKLGIGWDGSTIRVYVNDTEFFTSTDPAMTSLISPEGPVTVGMCGTSGTTKMWDNAVVIWDEGPAPEPYTGAAITATAEFQPLLLAPEGTQIQWTNVSTGDTASGLSPTLAAGTWEMQGDVGQVHTLNLGFNSTEDSGRDSLGAEYDREPRQPVTRLENMGQLTGLVRLLAATPSLVGDLDLTGMAALEHVECYRANLSSVTLTGCSSLIRLCLEENAVTDIDLTPVRLTLRDLRLAGQTGGQVKATCTGNLPVLWHYCLRGNPDCTHIPLDQLPVVEQWWVWNSGLVSSVPPVSTVMKSALAYGNALDQSTVDAILTWQDQNLSSPSGSIRVDGGTSSAPSAAGIAAAESLRGRGISVTHN